MPHLPASCRCFRCPSASQTPSNPKCEAGWSISEGNTSALRTQKNVQTQQVYWQWANRAAGVGAEVWDNRSYVRLCLQGGCAGPLGVLGSIPAWPVSSAAAQAAVAAAPFPPLHVEAEPPAVAAFASALLAVRKASCCCGKGGERSSQGTWEPTWSPAGAAG